MAPQILHELIDNTALLIVLSFVYLVIFRRWGRTALTGQILTGFLFGGVAVAVMLSPLHLMPGVVFDTRSVVISVGGFFGGPVVATTTFVIASIFRVCQGGAGALVGVLVSLSSAILGSAYFFWKRSHPKITTWPYLYGFGFVVHVVMLACMLALPRDIAWRVLGDIALPVIVIYPIATLLLCLLISEQEVRIDARRLLAASEKKYRRLVDTANEGVWVTDSALVTTFVNQKMADMLGYRIDELIGQNLQKFIYLEDLPAFEASLEKRRQGLSETYERRYLKKSGEVLWVMASASPVIDDHGVFAGSFAMITDIAERKRSEEAQAALLLRQKLAMDLAKLVHWEYDILTDIFHSTINYMHSMEPRLPSRVATICQHKSMPIGSYPLMKFLLWAKRWSKQSQPLIPIFYIKWSIESFAPMVKNELSEFCSVS